MKQLVGFVMFWMGIGILLTFFMPSEGWFMRALAAFVKIILGYKQFYNFYATQHTIMKKGVPHPVSLTESIA